MLNSEDKDTLLDIAKHHADSLIDSAKKGDERAFNKLVGLYHKRIYNFSYKYFLDYDLAMEVTQRTFIAMHKGIRTLRESGKFRPWLYRIAHNYCHQEDRSSKKSIVRSMFNKSGNLISDAEMKVAKDTCFQPDKVMQKQELSEIVLSCLNKLNPDQKEVVILKEYEGMKFKEIAEVLDISENTAKSRLYYGLKALRKEFERKHVNRNTVDYEI